MTVREIRDPSPLEAVEVYMPITGGNYAKKYLVTPGKGGPHVHLSGRYVGHALGISFTHTVSLQCAKDLREALDIVINEMEAE